MAMIPPKSHLFPAWMSLLEVSFFLDHPGFECASNIGCQSWGSISWWSISLDVPMSLRVIRSRSASDLKLTAVEAEGKRCEGKVKHGSSGSGFKFFNIKKTCTLKIGGIFSFWLIYKVKWVVSTPTNGLWLQTNGFQRSNGSQFPISQVGSPRSDGTCEAKGKASGKQRKHDYVDNSECQTTVIPGEGYEANNLSHFRMKQTWMNTFSQQNTATLLNVW